MSKTGKRLPVVALIGQTNAGKSSILNRLAGRRVAIVAREEGTTRDNVVARVDNKFILVDTAGLKDPTDEFEAGIQEQIADAVEAADVILVVVDATKYPDARDREIARRALKSRKPVALLLNKSDLGEALEWEEFQRLGVKLTEAVRTSATTGLGMREVVGKVREMVQNVPAGRNVAGKVVQNVPESSAGKVVQNVTQNSGAKVVQNATENWGEKFQLPETSGALKIALIGRPNVGKSSLFNALAQKQQAVVSARQGTTRDVNRVWVRYKGRELEILDTAGLRRPGKREVGIEKFSAVRTLAAIEEADVCALLVDGTEPRVKLDQDLAGEIVKAGKGIVMVVTKTDLWESSSGAASASADARFALRTGSAVRSSAPASLNQPPEGDSSTRQGSRRDEVLDGLERDFDFIPYAPAVLVSNVTGKNVTQLFELALEIEAARQTEVRTSELNRILADACQAHPPAGLKNTRPKLRYMVQTDTNPPWFVVYGKETGLLHWSYKRYLERKLREVYPFVGVPVFFSFREGD